MFELEELKQKSLAVKLGILPVYGEEDVNCFTIFTVTMAVALFALDGYKAYLPYHTFEVAYGSAMSCREAIGGSRDLNAFQYSEKICQKVPQLAEFIADGRESN